MTQCRAWNGDAPMFSMVGWVQQETGLLKFVGDQVMPENGYGAWQPYTYSCVCDAPKTLLKIELVEGRM
jgi:hypothetical protein